MLRRQKVFLIFGTNRFLFHTHEGHSMLCLPQIFKGRKSHTMSPKSVVLCHEKGVKCSVKCRLLIALSFYKTMTAVLKRLKVFLLFLANKFLLHPHECTPTFSGLSCCTYSYLIELSSRHKPSRLKRQLLTLLSIVKWGLLTGLGHHYVSNVESYRTMTLEHD